MKEEFVTSIKRTGSKRTNENQACVMQAKQLCFYYRNGSHSRTSTVVQVAVFFQIKLKEKNQKLLLQGTFWLCFWLLHNKNITYKNRLK